MSNLLRRCCDCNSPIGNRDKFCPRCGTRQPREPKLPACMMFAGVALLAVAANVQGADSAGSYPNKPVRVIVTLPPGGGNP